MFKKIRIYADFIKIEHTLFALPFAYAGAILAAEGLFSLKTFVLILTAFTGMRTLAMSLNRIFDRKIDALNPRTKDRHLPAGVITLTEARSIAFLSAFIYFFSAYLINETAFLLSPIPALTSLVYPFMKRHSCLSHYILGLNLAYAPMGGWIAVKNTFEPLGNEFAISLLGTSVIFWVAGFDIIYGLQDVEFDQKYNLHSIGAHFGVRPALIISAVSHLLFFSLAVLSLYQFGFGLLGKAGFVIVALLLIYQHIIVGFGENYNYNEKRIQIAFFNSNAVLSAVFLFSIVADTLIPVH